jgi:septum formation inhibitor-activating ATPase MinD
MRSMLILFVDMIKKEKKIEENMIKEKKLNNLIVFLNFLVKSKESVVIQ